MESELREPKPSPHPVIHCDRPFCSRSLSLKKTAPGSEPSISYFPYLNVVCSSYSISLPAEILRESIRGIKCIKTGLQFASILLLYIVYFYWRSKPLNKEYISAKLRNTDQIGHAVQATLLRTPRTKICLVRDHFFAFFFLYLFLIIKIFSLFFVFWCNDLLRSVSSALFWPKYFASKVNRYIFAYSTTKNKHKSQF